MDYHLKLDQSKPIVAQFRQSNWIIPNWCGELKLAVGYWVNGVLLGLAILAALLVLFPFYTRQSTE
ncbi:MAG TPA: hypothetical protein VEG37_11860 [Burkholderiales bacterium]|nr:hypothetical protein [Burkholderiales bacterium]